MVSLVSVEVFHDNDKSDKLVGAIHAISINIETFEGVISDAYVNGLVMARYLSPVIAHKFPTETYKIRL